MKTLASVNNLYQTVDKGASNGWLMITVVWEELRKFHAGLKNFEAALQLHDLTEEWTSFLSYLKRGRFYLVTTPLPPSQIFGTVIEADGQSIVKEGVFDPAQEMLGEEYDKLVEAFYLIKEQTSNPLWNAAVTDLSQGQDESTGCREIAVLCRDSRLVDRINSFLIQEPMLNVNFRGAKSVDLKGEQTYDQLIVFGSVRRNAFDGSDFVFKTPRAADLRIFTPCIFPTTIPGPYDFCGSPHLDSMAGRELPSFTPPRLKKFGDDGPHTLSADQGNPDQELLDTLPAFLQPRMVFEGPEPTDSSIEERVIAKQVLLSSNHAVYLKPDGSVYRIIQDEDRDTGRVRCAEVEHADVIDVGPDDILLFQAEGGGDMITELADQILGARRHEARSLQKLWKDILKQRIREDGTEIVAHTLKANGISIAYPVNVRNWASMANVGPGSWHNFEMILNFCNLEDKKEEIFQATKLIRSACQSAGFQLASHLLEIMKGRDLTKLMSTGRQEFSGGAAMPNSKVAYIVRAILFQTIEIAPNQLQRPFEIDRQLWL